jgi:hypothetical protein
MQEAQAVGPDPQPAVAVAQQLVGPDVAVGNPSVRAGGALKRVGHELVARHPPEPAVLDADQDLSLYGRGQVAHPHAGHRVVLGGPGAPSPEARFGSRPQGAGAVLGQAPDEAAEPGLRHRALHMAATQRAQLPLVRQHAGPDGAVAILVERGHELVSQLRILGELRSVPAGQAHEGANPQRAVARHQQAVGAARQRLAGRGLPRHEPKAVEAKQPERAAGPEIAVERLGHREDRAERRAVPGRPRGVGILGDLQGRFERDGGGLRAEQSRCQEQARHEASTA